MTNDGKELEYLVHLIERSINPDSVVELDVHLPVIKFPDGGKRQCDVVIRTGKPPRETITIVEAQDRTSRVDRTMFSGWVDKMKEVGAQHLICISRHDFPKSVKSKAATLGNSVRLITLKELDVDSLPLDFIEIVLVHSQFDFAEPPGIEVGFSKSETESLGIRDAVKEKLSPTKMNPNERCWSLDKNELVSTFILCRDFIGVPEGVNEGKDKFTFTRDEEPALYMYIDGQFTRVSLECEFSWTHKLIRMPAEVLSYEQNAWIAEASHETAKGTLSFKAPVIKTDEGYKVQGIIFEIPSEHSITLTHIKKQNI